MEEALGTALSAGEHGMTDAVLRRVAETELQRARRLLRLKPPTPAERKLLAAQNLETRPPRRRAEGEAMFRKISEEYPAEPRRARRKIARALLRLERGRRVA